MYVLAGKKNSAHQNNNFFSDYQKYDGHVLSRQPVLHFNVKLHIKKKYVVSLYLQDSVVMKTMLARQSFLLKLWLLELFSFLA